MAKTTKSQDKTGVADPATTGQTQPPASANVPAPSAGPSAQAAAVPAASQPSPAPQVAASMKSDWGMRLMLSTVIGAALLVIIGVVTLVITGVLPFRKVEFKKLDKPATIDIPSTEVTDNL